MPASDATSERSNFVPVLSTGTKIIPVYALFIPVPVLELELELEQ